MILVTGATGFLGSRLIQSLSHSHKPIRALTRSLNRLTDNLKFPNISWIECDVLDVEGLQDAMQGVENIYHCAAKVSFESRHHQRMLQVNVQGTANVVNAALASSVKKILHVSSTAALGRTNHHAIITENHNWKNTKSNSVYAQSKFLAEREIWRGIQEGLPAVIVNPSVIIGPGNWKYGTPRLFYSCRNGMPLYPSGVNAFVYVDDVVNCMLQLMNSEIAGERFILTSENISYKDFFTWITQVLQVSQPRIPLSGWATNAVWLASALLHKTFGIYPILTRETARTVNGAHYYSNEKIVKQLNYRFTPVKEFVTQTALQFRQEFYQVV